MIKFRYKSFSSFSNVKKSVDEWAIKNPNIVKNLKNPFMVTSTAGLGLNVANTVNNRNRENNDREFRQKEIDALGKLTNQLSKTSNSVNSLNNGIKSTQVVAKKPRFVKRSNGFGSYITLGTKKQTSNYD